MALNQLHHRQRKTDPANGIRWRDNLTVGATGCESYMFFMALKRILQLCRLGSGDVNRTCRLAGLIYTY